MPWGRSRKWLLLAPFGWACAAPALDVPGQSAGWSLELEPGVVPQSLPPVFRARVPRAPAQGEPWLLRDELSSYYQRQLQQGELSSALRERALPLRYWREGEACLLQPLVALEPGADYSLGFIGSSGWHSLRASVDAKPPIRLFPPPARDKHRLSVVCGMPRDLHSADARLEPGAVPLRIEPDVLQALAPGCAVLSVPTPFAAAAVAPPTLAGSLLEPSPWLPQEPDSAAEMACEHGQRLHGACIEVDDDRVSVTPLQEDQLWLLREPAPRLVAATARRASVLVAGLEPEARVALRGSVLNSGAERDDFELTLTLRAARRHVVLNEVLANPARAEASGEWIELVNDSPRPVELSGLWLEDASGHAPLPAVELNPGEHALLVGPGFRPAPPDVPVPDDVRLLELPSLGERGLSNTGEALLLVGKEGVISRFPGFGAPHAGRSWARRSPDAADDEPAAFAEHADPGASPGRPNLLAEAQ
jgi:hypothetical protein